MMHLMEDNREKKDGDETDFLPNENEDRDEAALKLDGQNPLVEEESIEEDDSSGD